MQLHPHFLFNSLNAVSVLRNGTELPLSRRRRERVSEAIRRFSR